MQVVILAGGKGTRLKDRLGELPKPLIDLCGVPLLERQILLAKRHGFTKVLILVNHRAGSIVEFCESRAHWGLDLKCIDDIEPLGTAGAVLRVFELLDEEFLVMYGDTMLEVDLNRFFKFHASDPIVAASLFLHPNDHPNDSDLVSIDENSYIERFHSYPHDESSYLPNLVNAALYWIRKSHLADYMQHTKGVLDFAKDLFPAMIGHGHKLKGYSSPEYIKDCGTPARIDKVRLDFETGRIERSFLGRPQKAVFIDRDGTINRSVDQLNSTEKFDLIPGVADAIKRLNDAEYRVVVVTNQPVIARGDCSISELRQIHNKMETLLGQVGAFVDRIYFCPHHPDSGYDGEIKDLKLECRCRKPNTRMIENAQADLSISMLESWMVGDTTTDILTAQNAKIKSILVETGSAGLDHKYWCQPDFILPNLPSAVSFILEGYPQLLHDLAHFAEKIEAGETVFVGGQSRSGKSTFANVLKHLLAAREIPCHVVSTDRWLLETRARGPDVLSRHASDQIINFLEHLALDDQAERRISLPGYNKLKRELVNDVEKIDISKSHVVIIEGVVALHFRKHIRSKHAFFTQIDEQIRKNRVVREYMLRGLSQFEAEGLYNSRLVEEVPWVESTAMNSTYFYKSSLIANWDK